MKVFVLALLLVGCAHEPIWQHHDINVTRRFFCQEESCPAFGEVHSYQVLSGNYDAKSSECVCEMLSQNSPDSWVVRIPIKAPADAPVDTL